MLINCITLTFYITGEITGVRNTFPNSTFVLTFTYSHRLRWTFLLVGVCTDHICVKFSQGKNIKVESIQSFIR